MTTDEKIEKLARAIQRLADIMATQPHEAPTIDDFTDHTMLQAISKEMTEIIQDR
jgi:hypothetical protein